MARLKGSKNKASFEFMQRFDELARDNIDPLKLMFQVAAGKADEPNKPVNDGDSSVLQPSINAPAFRVMAAKELLGLRYPKLKAIEIKDETEDQQLEISWLDDEEPDALEHQDDD